MVSNLALLIKQEYLTKLLLADKLKYLPITVVNKINAI